MNITSVFIMSSLKRQIYMLQQNSFKNISSHSPFGKQYGHSFPNQLGFSALIFRQNLSIGGLHCRENKENWSSSKYMYFVIQGNLHQK